MSEAYKCMKMANAEPLLTKFCNLRTMWHLKLIGQLVRKSLQKIFSCFLYYYYYF